MSASNLEIKDNDLASWIKYYLSKSILIISVSIFFGIGGILYAWMQKAVYKADLVFALESDNSSKFGGLSGLASQFIGLDMAGGNIFEGDNLIELLKTRNIIEKTLLSSANLDGKEEILINRYLAFNEGGKKNWKKDSSLNNLEFVKYPMPINRVRDSIMSSIIKKIIHSSLQIERPDKKLSFIHAMFESKDELFAKAFLEKLAENAITFYTEYKSKKTRQNVNILQHQVDSVESALTGNVYKIAESNDLNINPAKQIGRAYSQRRQIDVQVNGVVYGELLKNLELGKMTLRKETPLIQIIDKPILPLEMKKLGRLMAGVLFGIGGGILMIFIFFLKRTFLNDNAKQ